MYPRTQLCQPRGVSCCHDMTNPTNREFFWLYIAHNVILAFSNLIHCLLFQSRYMTSFPKSSSSSHRPHRQIRPPWARRVGERWDHRPQHPWLQVSCTITSVKPWSGIIPIETLLRTRRWRTWWPPVSGSGATSLFHQLLTLNICGWYCVYI